MHRWESHKKAADIARRDNTNIADLEAYFSATFGVRTADVNFLNPTLSTLMGGRLMLSWSYVREFYTENKRISQVEKVRRLDLVSCFANSLQEHVDVWTAGAGDVHGPAAGVLRKGQEHCGGPGARVQQVEAGDRHPHSRRALLF
jgi:hypothetical protein